MPPDIAFDDSTIAKLRLAAEEVAWLTGRGYPLGLVSDLVVQHHSLGDTERTALKAGTCSEPQYRRRAARELEAEDVARRALAVDARDVIAAVDAALAGRPLLQTLDGTVRALGRPGAAWDPGATTDEAIARILSTAKDLRASPLRMILEQGADGADDLASRIEAKVKETKAKAELVVVPDVRARMRKEPQIATGDAALLDACGAWFNLAGRIIAGIDGAAIVRLQ